MDKVSFGETKITASVIHHCWRLQVWLQNVIMPPTYLPTIWPPAKQHFFSNFWIRHYFQIFTEAWRRLSKFPKIVVFQISVFCQFLSFFSVFCSLVTYIGRCQVSPHRLHCRNSIPLFGVIRLKLYHTYFNLVSLTNNVYYTPWSMQLLRPILGSSWIHLK